MTHRDLTSEIINVCAANLFASRREPGDPMWEDLGFMERAYYRMMAKRRILGGLTCKSVSPDGERCVLVPDHRHPLRHKRTSEWD